jgi:hypothetical protein
MACLTYAMARTVGVAAVHCQLDCVNAYLKEILGNLKEFKIL